MRLSPTSGGLVLGFGLLLASPADAGEPVFLPDFTPATTSEFAVAFMLRDQVVQALEAQGHVILGSEQVAPVVGDTAGCAELPSCPVAQLPQLPTRVGIVVTVERHEGAVRGCLEVYSQGDAEPVVQRKLPVRGGHEALFAEQVAVALDEVVSHLGPSPASDLVAAVKLIDAAAATSAESGPGPDPDPEPDPEPDPDPGPDTSDAPRPAPPGADQELVELLRDTGLEPRHLKGAEGHFRRSELDVRDWVFAQTPHAGRLVFEVRGGMGFGDTDRVADVRYNVGNEAGWFQEGPGPGQHVRGALYVGYAPITFFDAGLLIGLQYGGEVLTYGWYGGAQEPFTSDVQSVQSVQLSAQARARLYLVHLGPAKPYVVLGPELRVFDDFDIESNSPDVVYPEPGAGAVPGVFGGGGLLVDPGPMVGFFFEGTYSRYFGVLAGPSQLAGSTAPADRPDPPASTRQLVGVVGGVQFRL